MKNLLLAIGIFGLMFFSACQSNPESKFIGTWKVVDVETDFDETRMTPQMIKQTVEMQEATFFKIINDSLMVIISTGNTHEAKWKLDEEQQKIFYTFDNWNENSEPFELGEIKGNQIVAVSDMPYGKMVVHFEKE